LPDAGRGAGGAEMLGRVGGWADLADSRRAISVESV
jgi:hypothetical protein